MRVLIVDDEASIRRLTRVAVEAAGHAAAEAPGALRALRMLAEQDFDVVFLDLKLAGDDGLDVLARIRQSRPEMAVVMFTAFANVATAVEAMRRGAFDFLPKPFTPEQIGGVLAKVEKTHRLERRVSSLESELAASAFPVRIESAAAAVQDALQIAFKAAETEATVLLQGPSGTGKTVLAREIHRRSPRRDAPFITVSCPSLSRELFESDLFGHVRGAFTGAVGDAVGKVAAASGGTLFLDEIGELPPEIQPKLLRLLEEREYERVGEPRPRSADVRLIAATNRQLAAEVAAGRFRQDLFYRLNVVSVTLPGLGDRPADLLRLADDYRRFFAERLAKKITGFSPAVAAAFAAYAWPGNLRELRNVVARAVILAAGPAIELADLPEDLRSGPPPVVTVGARVSLETLEAEHLRRVLALASNLDEAARILAIDPATLYRKRQRLGLL
jgi:NtrC-family two-component system response regulator AlgB